VFVFNFSEVSKPYSNYLDGLNFARIQDAPRPACDRPGEELGKASLAAQFNLPDVDIVMRWLDTNAAKSSQPYTVFVQVFEQAGQDATDLRVNRANFELYEKWNQRLTGGSSAAAAPAALTSKAASQSNEANGGSVVANVLSGVLAIFSPLADIIGIGVQWMTGAIADHGLRPAKAVWWVLAVLLVFWLWFWCKLQIVGFEPKGKDENPPSAEHQDAADRHAPILAKAPEPWPITFLFLFDRLIPIYQIREEHYSIVKVYRRPSATELARANRAIAAEPAQTNPAPPGGIQQLKPAVSPPPYPMRYMGMRTLVWPADDAERERFEKWLVVLRVIGIGLSVFLLAAVNTLISR
jgi:hypothetical protein